MKTSVKIDLLRTIINHYPVVPSHLIHRAGREYCLSGDRRLRELKKNGVVYKYQNHEYFFNATPPLILYEILRELER
jgi:hypothetical protein